MDRVLIIDDDIELCQLLAARMSDEGFEIEAVHEAPAGLSGRSRVNIRWSCST